MVTQLQDIVEDVTGGETPKDKISSLQQAFELFSQETVRLESAYTSLKQQFHSVNLQLEETNRQLNVKVQELDVTTNYLNSILNNMSQGIVFIDESGMITTYNHASSEILGIAAKDVLFQRFDLHFPDQLFGFSVAEALSCGQAPESAYSIYERTNRAKRELEVSTTFVRDVGMIILFRDITEIRHLQMVSKRQDRLRELGEMAAAVAHEIRNPLGGIKGFAMLLQRDLKESEQLHRLSTHIVEGSETLERLVSNVLNYSRPVQLQLELIDMKDLIDSVAALAMADSALSQNVTIKTQTSLKKAIAPVDKQLLQSALLNLIVNAVQAMPNGGEVIIDIHRQDAHIVLIVSDTGDGIAEENLEKIFSPFFTTKTEGNGFGLAEVHKIIEAHSGEICVTSTVDQGTTFTIKIPLENKGY